MVFQTSHDAAQLKADQHEHERGQQELDKPPDRREPQPALPGELRMLVATEHEAADHRREHARHVELLSQEVGDEARQEADRDVEQRVLQ